MRVKTYVWLATRFVSKQIAKKPARSIASNLAMRQYGMPAT